MARTAAHANDARRRPRLRHVIIAMALTGSVVVAGTGGSTGAGAAEPVRYLDRVFDAVDLTSDLTYLPADGPARLEAWLAEHPAPEAAGAAM